MKFSNQVDYKGKPHFVCKTGRKNIRILEPGKPYEKSFVVPLKNVSNRRPADFVEDPDEDVEDKFNLEDDDPAEELEEAGEVEDDQYQPQ